MDNFSGRIAVITGGGDGMGRELARQLAREGCHLALCDIFDDTLAATREFCLADGPPGLRVTTHVCDVGIENDIIRFRQEVVDQHRTDHVNLVFNNAGIGGGASMIESPRDTWERTFAVCWYGVYWTTRQFLPLLIAADEGHLVNTSSVNGFWASLGPEIAHTAYSAAKFAVKGFSEALVTDLRLNAPHVGVSVVMPGHIGTGIAGNTVLVHGLEADAGAAERAAEFRNRAPTSAAEAATVILDGVRQRRWRILVGDDAHILDLAVRQSPDEAYEGDFLTRLSPHFGVLDNEEGAAG